MREQSVASESVNCSQCNKLFQEGAENEQLRKHGGLAAGLAPTPLRFNTATVNSSPFPAAPGLFLNAMRTAAATTSNNIHVLLVAVCTMRNAALK